MPSTPTSTTHFRTSSSYTRALIAPKKSRKTSEANRYNLRTFYIASINCLVTTFEIVPFHHKLFNVGLFVWNMASNKTWTHTNGLPWESIDELCYLLLVDIIDSEYTRADTDPILPSGCPVKLLHTPITNQRRIQRREIISSHNDGHPGNLLFVIHTRKLNIGRIVRNVHEGGINHLVVHSVLCRAAHAACSRIEIVNKETTHLPFLSDDVCSFPVALSDKLGWLTGIPALQLSSTHCDRAVSTAR